jgi:acyl-CoA synthetase (NDP forming)
MAAHFLKDFLHPESIAIYGANNSGTGLGSVQLMNIILCGYKGKVYPIHLKLDSVFGYKAYRSIGDVPEIPELVIVVLPPKIVPQVFKECGEKGVKHLILISGGFRELEGEKENTYTDQIKEIANEYGMRFIGPNCLGFYNNWIYPEDPDKALNTSIWEKLERGKFSIASQSGTLSSHIFFDPDNLDIGLSKSISVGNEADIDVVDCLEYFQEDKNTDTIGLYIEELKRGRKFLELAEQISVRKPIVAIYAGGSKASNRAIKSHTGSMGGNEKIYEGVFKETGIIKTQLVEEFLDMARVFSKNILPKGNRLGIVTNSGGPGIMIANHAEKAGLIVPEFSKELKEKLKSLVPKAGSFRNPVDYTFNMNLYNYYVSIPKALMKSGEIDVLIIYGTFDFQSVIKKYLTHERIAKYIEPPPPSKKGKETPPMEKMFIAPILADSKKYSIPVLYINPQPYSSKWSKKMRKEGALLFQLWDRPIRCISKVCEYSEYRRKKIEKKT